MKKRAIAALVGIVFSMILATFGISPASAGVPAPPPPASVYGTVPDVALPDVPLLTPVAYAKGYHIRNHYTSVNEVYIYQSTDCTGTDHVLYKDESAQSSLWQSAGMWSSRQYSVVKIYDRDTGNHIDTRTIEWWECMRQYTTRSYLWVVKWK